MVNEYVYCPRLAYLMWSQAEWAETGDTVDGNRVHRRVDKPSQPLPDPEDLPDDADLQSRSITLSSDTLGVVAKMDIVEAKDGSVTPIDYKRGKRPHARREPYDPERVQVCLQAILLEQHGYRVEEGAIWYAESRERVRVVLDSDLRAKARDAVSGLRRTVASETLPPPLQDSPKCPRCALVSVCLPDEMKALGGSKFEARPIAVGAAEGLPLVVQSHRGVVRKKGNTLTIVDDNDVEKTVRLNDVSDVTVFGNTQITTPALASLMELEIPVAFYTFGGWFRGVAHGTGSKNVEVRTAQYRNSFDDDFCLQFSRGLVSAKITNQRTMLRRNWKPTSQIEEKDRQRALYRLSANRRAAAKAPSIASLLGIEGDAAASYFRAFAGLLRTPRHGDETHGGNLPFSFSNRNRRPPSDPVNAMLSLLYAMLTRQFTNALATVGLDPYKGYFHAPRYGKPALALDLMESFRPLIADSVVLSVINSGEIRPKDFVSASAGTALTSAGRRRVITAYERRLSQQTTHPNFGYRLTMRQLLLLQARLLCRHLLGELPTYPHYLPR